MYGIKVKENHESHTDECPGAPDVLTAADVPSPALADPSSVLVKLHAAGVNPIDTEVRKLNMYYPDKLPSILGCDGVGVVEAVGGSVTRVRPGDEVFFFNNGLGGSPGTYAEYTVVRQEYPALKPKNVSMLEAAATTISSTRKAKFVQSLGAGAGN